MTPDSLIRFRCPCGAKLKASLDKVGAMVGCPACLARVVVPAPPPPTEVDLAEVDDTPDPPRRKRRPEPRDEDDGVPIRGSRRRGYEDDEPIRSSRGDIGPKVVRWVLIASLVSFAFTLPCGCLVSQFSPMFGSWITVIADPFSPVRMQAMPMHLLVFGGVGMFFTAAITAACVYLSHTGRHR